MGIPLGDHDVLTWSTARPTQGRTTTRPAGLAYTRSPTEEESIQYVRVPKERRRAEQENLPPPDFVDLDSADYDRWPAHEIDRKRMDGKSLTHNSNRAKCLRLIKHNQKCLAFHCEKVVIYIGCTCESIRVNVRCI